ncbi:MAG TPA: two-component regulator propeller domain-containing protein [Chitinophagaceae bacterium]|nr:two-component regulator propeller domain-containing protein [Chitinophagaceae bacterium]
MTVPFFFASAQLLPSYIFHHIDYSDGLISNDIRSITQDRSGYIWIGSMRGLQRYDGHRFVSYPDTTANISEGMAALSLYAENADNSVEYINNARLMRWEGWRNKLVEVESKKKFQGEKYLDDSGHTWLIDKPRMCKYDITGNIISAFFLWMTDSTSFGYAPVIKEKDNDSIWLAVIDNDPLVFNTKTKRIYTAKHNEIHHPFLQQWGIGNHVANLGTVRSDSYGNIWFPSWSENFFRYNIANKILRNYRISDIVHLQQSAKITDRVVDILEDNHGIIWLATEGIGLLRYDPAIDKFSTIQYDPKNSLGIQYNTSIYCLFQDKEENIWVGTDRGISIFNPYRQNLNALRIEQDNTSSLQKGVNAVIQTNKGDILVGTWGGGIIVFDREYNFKKAITFNDSKEKNLVWSFIQNDDGTIWAGCQHGWLHIINPDDLSIQTIQPPELEKSTVWCMDKDRSGNILFGLHNGKIAVWIKATKKFYSFNNNLQLITGYTSAVVRIFIDNNQNYWASTWKGFKQFDLNKRIFTVTYQPDKGNPGSIASLRCTGIEEYNDSILVIGTQLGGLNFFNKHTKTFWQIPVSETPANNSVFAIKKDTTGNIWFATDYDIYKYNPLNKKFIACNIEKGMITVPFTENSTFYSAPGGQWFVTTNAEVLRFYPANIIDQEQNQKPVTITGFKVSGKSVFIDSLLHAGKPVRLGYTQNFISIEFSALNFSSAQKIKYYYKLDGINEDWVDAGANSFANYTKLPPGKYLFKVKTNTINENKNITSFTIIIAVPFWQTWWFITLIALIIVLLVYFFYRYRLQQILKVQQVRNRIASDLHDDIGSALTNINILSSLSKKNISETEKANEFLKRISEEATASSQALDDIIWSVNASNDTLEETITRMRRYAAELFDATGTVKYQFEVDESIATHKLNMEQRRDLYLIFKESLNNILKHAAATEVFISIHTRNDRLLLQIKDNGKGFDITRNSHRNGLKNLHIRTERWKGSVRIDSTVNKGTKIDVSLPIMND